MIGRLSIISIIILTIVQLLVLNTITYSLYFSCEEEKVVKCYDRHNNEIVGQTCLQKKVECPNSLFIIILTIVGSVGIILFNVIYFWRELSE